MRTVLVLFDALNRHHLGPYGGTRVATPSFDRLPDRRFRHTVSTLRHPLRRMQAVPSPQALAAPCPVRRSWAATQSRCGTAFPTCRPEA